METRIFQLLRDVWVAVISCMKVAHEKRTNELSPYISRNKPQIRQFIVCDVGT